ncbi:zonular occludens toxin domain-containing protein, partial [Xanthomonas vasicola]|uniref:zonular occludens toxin domain-containing protein n=1 Tax=Xanthomonas vasicola TaxID=56459 RepID=UPI0011ABB9B6
MLVFNEGVPRAGKSYDAVKNHILPALKKGRRVFARLNGLRFDRIAKHLGIAESDVRSLLVLVDLQDVAKLFACTEDGSRDACMP